MVCLAAGTKASVRDDEAEDKVEEAGDRVTSAGRSLPQASPLVPALVSEVCEGVMYQHITHAPFVFPVAGRGNLQVDLCGSSARLDLLGLALSTRQMLTGPCLAWATI